jgi:hypothetical protein
MGGTGRPTAALSGVAPWPADPDVPLSAVGRMSPDAGRLKRLVWDSRVI